MLTFPCVFIDSSQASPNSAPSTKKDAALEIAIHFILFDSYVFSCQIFQQGDFVMIDRGRKYRRQNNHQRQQLLYNQVTLSLTPFQTSK